MHIVHLIFHSISSHFKDIYFETADVTYSSKLL